MKTGVIVGRFQCPDIHEGHRDLIDFVLKHNEQLVIVIGESPTKFTNIHPLEFETRKIMIEETGLISNRIKILSLMDHPSDEQWCRNLDELVSKFENITMYGSRDSFLKCYTGRYPTCVFMPKREMSSTFIRDQIRNTPVEHHDHRFRTGIIYATQNKFPTVYCTVDIALIGEKGQCFLLGRKPGESFWRFPGGFIDPADASLADAAKREFFEEVIGYDPKNFVFQYSDSFKTDDWRYLKTSDSTMTVLFITYLPYDQYQVTPAAGDDLLEVRWFKFKDFDINILGKTHHILYNKIKPPFL